MPAEAAFDRPYVLDGFVDAARAEVLADHLAALLGPDYVLEDEHGHPLVGGPACSGWAGVDLVHELEVLGRLRGACGRARLAAAGALLEIGIAAAARDRMTAELHLAAMQDNYLELTRKNASLMASEARHRELAAQLEERVKEQVVAIEVAQRQLYQAEKMAAVGQLAAGMAHEINNPIGFIHSNLRTARGYLGALNEAGRALERGDVQAAAASWRQHELGFVLRDFDALLEECESGSRRIAAIVADLKAYSSIDASPAAPVDIGAALQVVARLARSQFDDCPRIVEEIAPMPAVHGDAGRLSQAFMNVLVNAIQATRAGGEIRLLGRPADGGVRVEVRDDGCGIAAGILPRVFDPFFTTRAPGAGTGLGLTVSRDIVLAHGGRIDIRSATGRGTSVTLWLPGTA